MKTSPSSIVRIALAAAIGGAVLASFIHGAALAGEVSYGGKIGFIMANISGTPKEWDDNTSYRTGFTGGVYLSYAFDEDFSIEPEILYTVKGVKSNLYEYEDLVSVDLTASFSYIEIPVLLTYTFSGAQKVKPRVYAGPSFAYNLSSEVEIAAWPLSVSADVSSLTHVTDFGIVAGGGISYPFDQGALTLDARFQYGFTNVIMSGDFNVNGSPETISVDDFKNYGFSVMIGYGF